MIFSHFFNILVISAIIGFNVSAEPPGISQQKPPNQNPAPPNQNIHNALPPLPNQHPGPEIDLQESVPKNKIDKKGHNGSSNDKSESNKAVAPPTQKTIVEAVVDDPNEQVFQSGALTRGILVLVGLTCLFLCYAGFKTYRNRNRRHKRRTVVRRYGGKKYDVEMEPLPLSDEEDETIFELNGSTSNHQ